MFDLHAERTCWELETASPPTSEELEFLDQDMKHWVPNFPALFNDKAVLDLGAGRALLGILVAERYSPRLMVSLDIGLHRLRAASAWFHRLKNFAVICGDAFKLPFPDHSFDYVVANSLLHHFPDLDKATAEISRVLRPGGYYIGREPNFDNPIVRIHVFKFDGTWLRHQAKVSANEYPLRAEVIRSSFSKAGCSCEMHYFWRRLRFLRHPKLSMAISVRAQRLTGAMVL
jgi:ubiquinone/menaquinone biosynthesis C-methylase UbiE